MEASGALWQQRASWPCLPNIWGLKSHLQTETLPYALHTVPLHFTQLNSISVFVKCLFFSVLVVKYYRSASDCCFTVYFLFHKSGTVIKLFVSALPSSTNTFYYCLLSIRSITLEWRITEILWPQVVRKMTTIAPHMLSVSQQANKQKYNRKHLTLTMGIQYETTENQ